MMFVTNTGSGAALRTSRRRLGLSSLLIAASCAASSTDAPRAIPENAGATSAAPPTTASAGPLGRWACFDEPCVPIYRGLNNSGERVQGEVTILSLETLEPRLTISVSCRYPDFIVPQVGFIGTGSDGIVYWTSIDGSLTVRKRATRP